MLDDLTLNMTCMFTWTSPVSEDHRTECSRGPRTLARTGAPSSLQELLKTERTQGQFFFRVRFASSVD